MATRRSSGAGVVPLPSAFGPDIALHDSGKIYSVPILSGGVSEKQFER